MTLGGLTGEINGNRHVTLGEWTGDISGGQTDDIRGTGS